MYALGMVEHEHGLGCGALTLDDPPIHSGTARIGTEEQAGSAAAGGREEVFLGRED